MRVAHQIAVAILGSFFVFGVIETFAEELYAVHLCLLAVLGFAWCKADVRDRDISEPIGSALLVGATGVIGVPIYFIRSRPMKQALGSMVLFFVFSTACIATYIVAAWMTEVWYR